MPLLSILVLALMIGATIDIIMRDESQVKHLPKLVWVLLVVLLPLIGAILWFLLGREYGEGGIPLPKLPRRKPRTNAPAPPAPQTPPADTRTTEQQMADLDREIEEWRLREEIAKRKRDETTD